MILKDLCVRSMQNINLKGTPKPFEYWIGLDNIFNITNPFGARMRIILGSQGFTEWTLLTVFDSSQTLFLLVDVVRESLPIVMIPRV